MAVALLEDTTPERPHSRGPHWYRVGRIRALLVRRSMTKHPATAVIYRFSVAVIGAVVMAVGLVLVPLPGPGWLIVFFGIAITATEFDWAKRLLVWTRTQVQTWTHKFRTVLRRLA